MEVAADISLDLLANAVGESRDGIVIANAHGDGFPLVYVNRGFENLTGYAAREVIGKSFDFLLGNDTGQPEASAILPAIAAGEGCVVTLRNYRKDGSMFWSETSISPVCGAGNMPTHFIGIQKDVTDRIMLEQRLICAEPLAEVGNRRHFEERLSDSLVFTRRAHAGMSLLMIEVDFFGEFIERYGHSAADECLCRVGGCVSKLFLRMSDCVARYDENAIAVVSMSFGAGSLRQHALKLCERVRTLNIPHSGSPHGTVTITIGGVHIMPVTDTTEEMVIKIANSKLLGARRSGGNSALIIG